MNTQPESEKLALAVMGREGVCGPGAYFGC